MFKKLHAICLITLFGVLSLLAGTNTPVEKVMVTTDRDVYIAGDWVYFSIKIANQGEKVSDFIYLTLSSNNQHQIFTGCLKLNNNAASGSIYLSDTLTTGVYQLVSYTNCMRNYGPEVFAIKNILVANRFNSDVKEIVTVSASETADSASQADLTENTFYKIGKLNKEVFSQREQVKLDIRLPEEIPEALVSVSVREVAPVNLPETKLNKENVKAAQACYYLPEHAGLILQGTIKVGNNTSVAERTVFLSCKDSIANLQFASSDNHGVFRFFLNPYYFGKDVVIQVEGENKSAVQIESKYFEGIIGNLSILIHGDIESFLEMGQKYLGIQRSYNESYREVLLNHESVRSWRPAVYANVGEIIAPADYLNLPDFREISREILPYFKIREKQDDFVGSVLDVDQKIFSTPFIFLDGVLLEHVRQIMYLDSKKIKTIVTIPNARFLGNLYIPGMLDITSNSSEIEKVQWLSPVAKIKVENLLPNFIYKTPEINEIPRYIPAYLQLLYWNPALQINSGKTITTSFFTSDCTGSFEVVIKGFSSDGKEIEFRKLFDVISLKE
jgi:hypothetical protein